MAESKGYWQMLIQQVCKLTNNIANSLNQILSMFSRSEQNAMLNNSQQWPEDIVTNTTPRLATGFSTPIPSSQVMREIVAGYRRGLARHLTVNTCPGVSIFGTIIDSEQSEILKLEREAAKAEKEMLVTTLTVAKMQIAQMTKRQKELEGQVIQLQDSFKLPEIPKLDLKKVSYDISDIRCVEEPPKPIIPQDVKQPPQPNIPQDVKQPVISPRSMKSKLPRPIPIKPKKLLNDANQSPKAKPTC